MSCTVNDSLLLLLKVIFTYFVNSNDIKFTVTLVLIRVSNTQQSDRDEQYNLMHFK